MTGVCINYKYFFKYSDDNLLETQDWNLDVHFLDKGGIHRKPNNFGFHTIGLDDLKGMFSVDGIPGRSMTFNELVPS